MTDNPVECLQCGHPARVHYAVQRDGFCCAMNECACELLFADVLAGVNRRALTALPAPDAPKLAPRSPLGYCDRHPAQPIIAYRTIGACPGCGAPNCCPRCCEEAHAEAEADAPKASPCCLCSMLSKDADCRCGCHKPIDPRTPKPWMWAPDVAVTVTDREIVGDAPKPASDTEGK